MILFRLVANKLAEIFPSSTILQGNGFFSIKCMDGTGKIGSIHIEELHVVVNPLSIFNLSKCQILHIECQQFYINISDKKLLKTHEKKIQKPLTIRDWALKRILLLLVVAAANGFSMDFSDLQIEIDDFEFSLDRIAFLYNRNAKFSRSIVQLTATDLRFSFIEPLARLHSINISFQIPNEAIERLIQAGFSAFSLLIPYILLKFDKNQICLEISRELSAIPNEKPNASCLLHVDPIIISVPFTNLFTKSISITISSISINRLGGEIESIVGIHNKRTLLRMPAIRFNTKKAITDLIDITIPLPLILDILTIYHNFIMPYTSSDPRPLSLPYQISVKKVKYAVHLSDDHLLVGDGSGLKFRNQDLTVNEANLSLQFDQIVKVLDFEKLKVHILNTKSFHISVRSGTIEASPAYNIKEFISSLMAVVSYITDYTHSEKDIIPTPFDIVFTGNRITMKIMKKELADPIQRALAAKAIAMEGLLLRREKAMKYLSAHTKAGRFNMEEFDNKSVSMLRKLFKEAFNESPSHDSLMQLVIHSLYVHFDGRAVKDREECLKMTRSLFDSFEDEEVGGVNAGLLDIKAKSLVVSSDKLQKIAKFSSIKVGGWITMLKPVILTKDDVIVYSLDCGDNHFDVMDSTVKTGITTQLKASIRDMEINGSTHIFELINDIQIALSESMKDNFFYKTFHNIDLLRFQIHLGLDLSVHQTVIEVGRLDSPFSHEPLANLVADHIKLSYVKGHCSGGISCIDFHVLNQGKMDRFLRFPKMKYTIEFSSRNYMMDDNSPPLFVPVRSSKIMDPSYEPYEYTETNKFSVSASLDFSLSKRQIVLNADYFQQLIDYFMFDLKHLQLVPFTKSTMRASFLNTCVKITLPSVSVSMLKGRVGLRMTSTFFNLMYINKGIRLEIHDAYVDFLHFNHNIGFANVKTIIVDVGKSRHNVIQVDDIGADISSTFLNDIMDVHIVLPPSKKKPKHYDIHPLVSSDGLVEHFKTKSLLVTVTNLKLQLIFKKLHCPVDLEAKHIQLTQWKSKVYEESMFTLDLNQTSLNASHFNEKPLILLSSLSSKWLSLGQNFLCFMNSKEVSVVLNPEFVNTTIPVIEQELFPKRTSNKKSSDDSPLRNSRFLFIMDDLLTIKLESDEPTDILTVIMSNFVFDRQSRADGSETSAVDTKNIEIYDERAPGSYHTILRGTSPQEHLLTLKISKERKLMKCPIFNQIDVNIGSCVLRINMEVINEIIGMFPFTSDLNVFDLENADEDEESSEHLSTPAIATEESIGFFRLLHISQFKSNISYCNTDFLIKEVHNREFVFEGTDITDMFGSVDQLKERIKKAIRIKFIKGVIGMAVRKKKI